MSSTEPTSVRFLLCDDVRSEIGGKLILIGLYPDDKILVASVPGQPIPQGYAALLPQLAIVCVVFDGNGPFPTEAKFVSPLGQVVVSVNLGSPQFVPGVPATFVLKAGTFPVTQYGRHELSLSIGSKSFPFHFDILAQPNQQALPLQSNVTHATRSARKKMRAPKVP
jgi:hypothetical protein